MDRVVCLVFGGIIFTTFTLAAAADPPAATDAKFAKDLAVQNAMQRARILVIENQPGKAVDLLEEQLANVNGNPQYLVQLRDAYRVYIMDLYLTGRPEVAKRYFDRLCILDPSAVNDAALKPRVETAPRKFEADPPKQPTATQFPTFKVPGFLNPFAAKDDPKQLVKPVARAASEDISSVDPFDAKFKRSDLAAEPAPTKANTEAAREFLKRGEAEFQRERYGDARKCFEQAYQADNGALEACRPQWAYCIIKGVTEAMDQPGVLPAKLPELKQQVENAIGMAPGQMMVAGKTLLSQLDQRAGFVSANPRVPAKAVSLVRHWGQNKEGWQVAETPHFRVFHRMDNDFAERVADIVEKTRAAMYKKWFESDGIDWQPHCEVIVHPNAASYTDMTGVPAQSPGHSRIDTDPSGRVTLRRLDIRLDIPTTLECVLPHEATHVVLAGMFGNQPVPRWADEGIAVLSEPAEKIEQHRRNLAKHHADGLLFGLKELMELKDYPHPRRTGAFYAQSTMLVEFLASKKGPKIFTDFVRDGARQGYDLALQRHYNLTFTQLEQAWQQQVINNRTTSNRP